MTSAYILIIAILVLGGLIAALGDRIGTKVGKARLTIFNLRPRQTATLVTIVTGVCISATTLLLLFGLSGSLRQGVFELDEILKKRRQLSKELEAVRNEKIRVESQLLEAQKKQENASRQLALKEREVNEALNTINQYIDASQKLKKEVSIILKDKQRLLGEKEKLEKQKKELEMLIARQNNELKKKEGRLLFQQAKIEEKDKALREKEAKLKRLSEDLKKLEYNRKKLEAQIKERDTKIAEIDKMIARNEELLAMKEEELGNLERELAFYRKEVEILEQYYQTYQYLRERPIAILKGQVLNITLVDTRENRDLTTLIDVILNEANRGVMRMLGYGNGNQLPRERYVTITRAQVEQIKQQIATPGQYLIRIISAGNYVVGEEKIRVFADVTPNVLVYRQNQPIASITIEEKDLNSGELQEKLDFLISVSQFRARREGILGEIIVGDGSIISLVNFIQKVRSSPQQIEEIRTIAAKNTYASGPLQINLVAFAGGQEILRL